MKRRPADIRNFDGWTQADFEQDLLTNPRYQEFYKKFDPKSIPEFAKEYSKKKADWYKRKEEIMSRSEYNRTHFFEDAQDFLKVIMQKKLFNLQCLWRAGQIELPFIEYSTDFEYFGKHILECPFLDPITEKEIEVAVEFLMNLEEYTELWSDYWQNYPMFKNTTFIYDDDRIAREGEAYDKLPYPFAGEDEIMPLFYAYYDRHFDTGGLFDLPDVRYEEEKYYFDIWLNEEHRLEKLEQDPNKPPYVYIPSLYAFDPDEFILATEDPITIDLSKADKEKVSWSESHDLGNDLEFLLNLRMMGETIAFVPDEDWYRAIKRTIKKVTQTKIAELLPYAYDTYMMQFEDDDWENIKARRIQNFSFGEEGKDAALRSYWRKDVIKGKRLLGEL